MTTDLLEAVNCEVEESWSHNHACLPVLEDLPKHIIAFELSQQFDNDLVIAVMQFLVAHCLFELLQFFIVVTLSHLLRTYIIVLYVLLWQTTVVHFIDMMHSVWMIASQRR